ncbi:FAD-dependent monooxygenase [Streptomyces sp. NPDC018031]|uniref:FAD-dependent monooxygenase n=1 Tax=Streptomyces sp. NPDC018031 TaxID=3365033 RepID=UPI00379C4080
MTDALIIGGGVAGVVTAMALQKAGIRTVVHESHASGADDAGAFLTVFANGLEALRAIDAHQPVIDASFPADRVDFISNTGKRLGSREIAGAGEGTGARTLKRATLYRVLHEEADRRGVRIEHGKRFAAAHTAPNGRIVASFADGGRAQGDILIGADGIHSLTRKMIDAAAPRPRFTGQTTVCGFTRDVPEPPGPGAYTMIYGKRAFFGCTVAPDGEVWWFANAPGPELPRAELAAVTPEQWRERLTELFAEDRTPAADIIRATGDTIVASNAYDLATIPNWYGDAMIVIGDAAHAAAPNAAQGASMAMEDGVVLAACLRDLPRRRAFAAFERIRRERVERVVATSAAMARQTTPGALGRMVRDTVLPRRLDRGGAGADAWLTGHRIDWDATVEDGPRR